MGQYDILNITKIRLPGLTLLGSRPERPAMKKPEPKIPADLRKSLATSSKVEALWKSLTPIARRDWISWIDSAKQEETRKRRIEQTSSKLLAGKRRPCCYSLVPMNFLKALGSLPKAKATWHTLTPHERRDFADWVNGVKDPEIRKSRIEKACVMLGTGKKHP